MVSSLSRGSLFAIGGREVRSGQGAVLEQFVARAGGEAARIVVLTTASPRPRERAVEYQGAFRSLGVSEVSFFHQENREQSGDPALLDAVDAADAVFLTGGNQLKLVTRLAGTPIDARLRERHQQGMHLAGTSAGAAALSSVMIARGRARSAARLGAVRMSAGLGILPFAIVDQHFRERDRFGRLLAAVLCNPSLIGIGIDEDTAFELDCSNRLSVVGSGSVTIVDASQIETTNVDVVPEESPVGFAGMRMHVLTNGWNYDVATRSVTAPLVDPGARKATGGGVR